MSMCADEFELCYINMMVDQMVGFFRISYLELALIYSK